MTLAELQQHTYSMFLPPRELTVSEWADENRMLVSENSSEPGRWQTSRAPYQREIMDAMNDPHIERIVVKSSAQVGKSEILNNCIGACIDMDPGPMMLVEPTDELVKAYSKERIAPMIENCEVLKQKVSDAKTRDGGNTVLNKRFPGGFLTFAGANAPSGLRSRPIRYLYLDEVDAYPRSAGTEGDPVLLAMKRTETFHNRKIVMVSTPTLDKTSRIDKAYRRGTQEEWCVLCPKCGVYSYIKFEDIRFSHEYDIVGGQKQYTASDIRWRCPNCLTEHTEYASKRMKAKWVARNPGAREKGVRSFRMNAFVSPWGSWEKIILAFLDAHENDQELQVFYNTVLGETWELRDRSGKPEEMYKRREPYAAEVPDGVLVLTCGVDTQDNRLEYEVVGWGRNDESWGIQRGALPGDPELMEVWEELDNVLDREWGMTGGRALRISVTFVDSGGHKTQSVYQQCAARSGKRVFPIKGDDGEGRPYVALSKKSQVLFILGVDSGKQSIISASAVETAGPRYCHFPDDERTGYDMDYFRGLLSEKLVVTTRRGRNVTHWEKMPGVRNEPLDCRNYARAAFKAFPFDLDKTERRLNGEPEPKKASTKRKQRRISEGIQV